MGKPVVQAGLCKCMFGNAPSPLNVLPSNMVMAENKPAATIMDNVPMLNVMPFGMCMSMANPMVAAATAMAFGVLTPMPCIPVTTAPWIPVKPTVMIKNLPILDDGSMLMCNWGGMIQVNFPGCVMCSL